MGNSAGEISPTNQGVTNDDARLSDARTPTAHASTHVTGGADALTPADIGAATSAQGAKADSALQPTGNGSGLTDMTKAQVGLGNVDNTSDADKPVSTAQATAIGLKANTADLGTAAFTASTEYATAAQGAKADSTLQCRKYSDGYSYFSASTARFGWLNYGASNIFRILVSGTGIGTLTDMEALKVECIDPDAEVYNTRIQVSIELDTGTLVIRTTNRVLPLVSWRRCSIIVDEPVSGTLSSSSIHVFVESSEYSIANSGLEIVGTDYSGSPVAGTGAWMLCADAAGTNTLSCRVASDGWHALNYPLTSAHWADWLATGRLPFEGAGGQFVKSALAWSFGDFDAAAASSSSLITENCMTAAELGARTDGAGSYVLRGTSLSATYYAVRFVVPSFLSYKVRFWARSSVSTTLNFKLIAGGGDPLATAALTTEWQYIETELTSTATTTEFIRCYILSSSVDDWFEVDDVLITASGEMIPGLDLSAQPVCSRTASGAVLLDSASGVELAPYTRPERMALATQLPMSADGYLLGDQTVVPAGYSVAAIEFEDVTSSATVTVRWASSSGTVLWTGSVTSGADYRLITLTAPKAAKTTAQKVYISGLRGSAKLLLDR
jgi:hypothetical protein